MALIQYLNIIAGLIRDGKTYIQVSKYLQCNFGYFRLFCKENNVKHRKVLLQDAVDSLVSEAVAEVYTLFMELVHNLFI